MKKKFLALTLSLAMAVGALAGCGSEKAADQDAETNDTQKEEAEDSKGDDAEDTAEAGSDMAVPEEITLYTYYADASIDIIDNLREAERNLSGSDD